MIWKILSEGKSKDVIDDLLKNRGIKTPGQKREFLNPARPEKITLKALGISRLETGKAIKRIKIALKNKEKVVVYGDYDADGICGTAVLWEALYGLGLDVLPYIPERFSEGYGLNAESVQKLKMNNPLDGKNKKLKIIITVDNGIVATKAVEAANKLGIDVIITDHHEIGKARPKAYAVVHTTQISGSAVAWFFAQEIIKNFKLKISNSLELAAIGTVSDQLSLIGPNRSIVKYGFEALAKTKRSGLMALFAEARIDPNNIGTYEVNFIIAPRLNAMGRLVHGLDSLRLLCTKNKERAKELATLVGKTNLRRQKMVEQVMATTLSEIKVESKGYKNKIIIMAGDYHEGVIGLAAAKLVEEFYRPAIVLSKRGKIAKASARSISGFNIIETIRKLQHLYIEGGGHPMAAGFSIETAKIGLFTQEINKLAKPLLTEELLSKKLKIDLEIDFNRINYDLYDKIKEFEPTGLGNFAPVFCTRKVKVLETRTVGKENKHLKLKLEKDGIVFDAIYFSSPVTNHQSLITTSVDVVYSIEDNFWNGSKSLQLKIKDMKILE